MTFVRDPSSFLPMMVPKSEVTMLVEEEGELTITCILCNGKLAYTRFGYIFDTSAQFYIN